MKLKSYVNRKRLAIELVLFDIIAIQLAAFLAILTRFEFRIHTIEPLFIDTLVHYAVLNTFCSICIFAAYRMYSTLWSFASIMDFFNVVKAVLISSVFQFIGIHIYVGMADSKKFYCIVYWMAWNCCCISENDDPNSTRGKKDSIADDW